MNISIKLLFIIQLFFSISFASTFDNQTINKLSKDEKWLKLLHYVNGKSDLLDDSFFLSPQGKTNSKEELIKTLDAYNSKLYKKDDSHPRCKFPARYYWLSQKLKLENYSIIQTYCKNLSSWEIYKNNKSLSLVLVSGYLGNPASTFGHSFIKLNSKKSQNDLFDLSVNYGALVPENEPILAYIFKGIFGGYTAGFSDKYFYTQDLVYSHNEFRDMWEYELNLKEKERKLFILHLWEIVGKKFQYFFLNKNCAYKVSESLELIIDDEILDKNTNWYAPVETFNTLEELNSNDNLIKSIKYIPSWQKIIYGNYTLLSKKEKNTVKNIIENKFLSVDKNIDTLTLNSKINSLDFLLDYIKYLKIKEPENKNLERIKNKLLLKRLYLPIKKKNIIKIKHLNSPAKGNKPILFKSGLSKSTHIDYYTTLGLSIFALESLGENSLDFDELIVADTQLAYKKDNKLFLDYFNLIKIKKLKTAYLDWQEDLNLSWKLNIGTEYIDNKDNKNTYNNFIDFSIGKAYKLNSSVYTYLMFDTKLNHKYSNIHFTPNINLDFDLFNSKNSVSYGYKITSDKEEKSHIYKIESQYKIKKDFSVNFLYKKDFVNKYILQLKWYF